MKILYCTGNAGKFREASHVFENASCEVELIQVDAVGRPRAWGQQKESEVRPSRPSHVTFASTKRRMAEWPESNIVVVGVHAC